MLNYKLSQNLKLLRNSKFNHLNHNSNRNHVFKSMYDECAILNVLISLPIIKYLFCLSNNIN